jgi:hypothetical protein
VSDAPLPSPLDEARRIIAAAEAASCTLRVSGGVAIALACPSALATPLARTYADIDLFGTRRGASQITELLQSLGYQPDVEFNALQGARRLSFWDPANGRPIDVFLDVFEMCHRLDLSERVKIAGLTMPISDLLVTKLQVMETNEKDLRDSLALLADHPLTKDDGGIDVPYIVELTAQDWGLWRTITLVAAKVDAFAQQLPGFEDRRDLVHERLEELKATIEAAPKSRSWRIRARVGERKRRYELPEEVH